MRTDEYMQKEDMQTYYFSIFRHKNLSFLNLFCVFYWRVKLVRMNGSQDFEMQTFAQIPILVGNLYF